MHRSSMRPERPFTKCISRSSYTLDTWTSRSGTCVRSPRSSTPRASPGPPRSSASPSRPCRARSPAWRTRSACGCCDAPAGRSFSPRRASGCWRTPAGCSPRSTTSCTRPGAGTPGCVSGTRGRRWGRTPSSSSAAGPRATPTSTCSWCASTPPTSGLAEGACDAAIVRAPTDTGRVVDGRIDGVVVGLESRYCALAADDPLARRRQLRLADLADRVVPSIPAPGRPPPTCGHPAAAPVRGDPRCRRLAGRHRHRALRRRDRREHDEPVRAPRHRLPRLRDAPPVPVRLIWWRDDSHPATRDVVGLLAELYRRGAHSRAAGSLDSSQSAPFIRVCTRMSHYAPPTGSPQ